MLGFSTSPRAAMVLPPREPLHGPQAGEGDIFWRRSLLPLALSNFQTSLGLGACFLSWVHPQSPGSPAFLGHSEGVLGLGSAS